MTDQVSQVGVNLRVLAKLKPGDRLQTVDSRYFGIDRGWFTWLTRWIRSDNRTNTVDRIEETFRSASDRRVDQGLIRAAKGGVRELCATYVGDETTVARLEAIISESEPAPDSEQRAF